MIIYSIKSRQNQGDNKHQSPITALNHTPSEVQPDNDLPETGSLPALRRYAEREVIGLWILTLEEIAEI